MRNHDRAGDPWRSYRARTMALQVVTFAANNGWKPQFNKFTRRHFDWSRNGVRFGVSWFKGLAGPWFHVRNEGTGSEQRAIQLLKTILTEVRA